MRSRDHLFGASHWTLVGTQYFSPVCSRAVGKGEAITAPTTAPGRSSRPLAVVCSSSPPTLPLHRCAK